MTQDDLEFSKEPLEIDIEMLAAVFSWLEEPVNEGKSDFIEKPLQNKLVEMLTSTLAQLDQFIREGRDDLIGLLINSTVLLAAFEAQHNNLETAKQLLAQARRRFRESGSYNGELWINLNMANICLQYGNISHAANYAILAAQVYKNVDENSSFYPAPPDRMNVYSILINIAHSYYEQKDFENAALVASQAIELNPQHARGYFELGNCQLKLRQFETAVETWKSAIAYLPANPAFRLNLAAALKELGRYEEAGTAVSEAIRLSPGNPKYYFMCGQINQGLKQHELAIADFTHTQILCKEMHEETEALSHSIQSETQDSWNMSYAEMDMWAHAARAESYKAFGHVEDAIADLDYCIQRGNQRIRSYAYLAKGDMYKELERYTEAIEAYSSLIRLFPEDYNLRLERADIYIIQGLYDEAIPDLAFVSRRDCAPFSAIDRLGKILAVQPGHPLACKWRGFAYKEAKLLSKAEEELTYTLTLLPVDADVYLWRGLTRMAFSIWPEEKYWNDTMSYERILSAIDDLGYALHLAPEHTEALTAYKWLVDRVSADMIIFFELILRRNLKQGIFNVVPAMREPLSKLWHSNNLSVEHKQDEGIKELRAAQRGLLEAGFPVWATRLHVYFADNYLSLHELQLARDHLNEAGKVMFLNAQPFDPQFGSMAEEKRKKRWQNRGQESLVLEFDYLHITEGFSGDFTRLQKLFEAKAHAYVGDMEQAITALGNLADFEKVKFEWDRGDTCQQLIEIAKIMRDAAEYANALELLAKAEALAESPKERGDIFNTFGTVQQRMHNYEAALDYFQRAFDIDVELGDYYATRVEINLAESYSSLGQPQKALDILERIKLDQKGYTDYNRLAYYGILAHIYWTLGRSPEAQKALLQALSLAESIRASFRTFDARISWQAGQEWMYRSALSISLANNHTDMPFELVERSKSRAFLDQLDAMDQ